MSSLISSGFLTFFDAFIVIAGVGYLIVQNFFSVRMNPPYTHMATAIAAQNRMLQHFLKSGYEAKQGKSSLKHGSGSLNYIEFHNRTRTTHGGAVKNTAPGFTGIEAVPSEERVLVLMHGYGLGLGFFFANYDALLPHFDRIIALDWQGMGASPRGVGRTAEANSSTTSSSFFTRLTHSIFFSNSTLHEERVLDTSTKVTDEFIDSLEEFRIAHGLEKFILAGHSLGGFLSANYALKYPKAVKGLILISPVGIPRLPPKDMQADSSEIGWQFRMVRNLWEMDITPQSIVRIMGRRGADMVSNSINARFNRRWNTEESALLSDYMYHITVAPGEGEYCLNSLLQPIFVKKPTATAATAGAEKEVSPKAPSSTERAYRTSVYARQPLEDSLKGMTSPVLMIFGDHDWLRYPTAEETIQQWRQCGVKAKLEILSNAGHHLYLDNSLDFNRLVADWSSDVYDGKCS
jgi:cardiolipin-specific phospholipase